MTELALTLVEDDTNPIVGDLRIVNGALHFTRDLGEEVAQRIMVRFNFWLGEYFLNLNAGTPYLTAIFEKGVPDNTIRSVLTQIIATTKGVASVDELSYTVDERRTMDVRFKARLANGATLTSGRYGPFVIKLGQTP